MSDATRRDASMTRNGEVTINGERVYTQAEVDAAVAEAYERVAREVECLAPLDGKSEFSRAVRSISQNIRTRGKAPDAVAPGITRGAHLEVLSIVATLEADRDAARRDMEVLRGALKAAQRSRDNDDGDWPTEQIRAALAKTGGGK